MRSRWNFVHFGLRGDAWPLSSLKKVVNLSRCADGPLRQSFHEDTLTFVFSNLQTHSVAFEQIADGLVVDLQIRDSYHELCLQALFRLNVNEYFFHCPRNDATLFVCFVVFKSFHRVRFACACLPISQDCCVVSLQHTQHSGPSCLLIHFYLAVELSIDTIKAKLMIRGCSFIFDVILTTSFSNFGAKVLLNIQNKSNVVFCSNFVDRRDRNKFKFLAVFVFFGWQLAS